MQDRNRSGIILNNDFRACTNTGHQRSELARRFRFRNVDHILSHNVIIHCHSSYLEDLRGAKDASRGESDNQLVIRRRFLMACKSRMAAHAIQVEQIIEVDHERVPPPTAHITVWGDVSGTAPNHVRNIEKRKKEKKSWYQYILLGLAPQSLGSLLSGNNQLIGHLNATAREREYFCRSYERHRRIYGEGS